MRKHLARRTVLRGMGATLALPLLDGMLPAFAGSASAGAKPPLRVGALYTPNGMNMTDWTPAIEGTEFQLTPILQPLAPYRNQLVVLSGLANNAADQLPGEGSGDHSRSSAGYLTGAHAKKTEGADLENGISMDQIVAKELGKQTQLGSLELALEANDMAGGCEHGYSCAYTGTVSWASAKTPLPMENDPRAVFERLFGSSESTEQTARLARIKMERSILDMVTGRLAQLRMSLGSSDRLRVTEYIDSVRDIERRIQRAEEQSSRELPIVAQPAGVPATYEEYAKLMFDLWALAWQCDLTRVGTFMFGREKSSRNYPEIGVPDAHHPLSHHQGRPEKLARLSKLNAFHMKLFAHFLEKLASTQEGDGRLLDRVMVVYGSGMSNSDMHLHQELPMLLVGSGGGEIKGGRHIRVTKDMPLANLHVTVLEKMGIPAERLGDSTGKIDL
ncbi:MAG TPA: DUF1552 domain-containing protein [Vicinamibacterales bacterium]|nr:DUF1552 domain-containing protein [Vicinamibacterales bacterium]